MTYNNILSNLPLEVFFMQIVTDRRALHKIPELELCLPKTMQYLKNALSGLKCRLCYPMDSAICAWFNFGADSTVAFRADCDDE